MNVLFWLLLGFDLITCIILLMAGDFRRSFTGNNPLGWVPLLMLGCVIAAPITRFLFKRQMAGLILAALPALTLLVWYLIDKNKGA